MVAERMQGVPAAPVQIGRGLTIGGLVRKDHVSIQRHARLRPMGGSGSALVEAVGHRVVVVARMQIHVPATVVKGSDRVRPKMASAGAGPSSRTPLNATPAPDMRTSLLCFGDKGSSGIT